MPVSPLTAALLGGSGENAGAFGLDPAIMQAQPELQLAQQMEAQGTSTAPAYPGQALARALQGAIGAGLQKSAISDLAKAYAGSADSMSHIFPSGTPIGDALRSPNPMVRMMALQQAPKAVLLGSEPYNLAPKDERRVGANVVATSGQPQSPEGAVVHDVNQANAQGNPAGAAALERGITKETSTPEGVQFPPTPVTPRSSALGATPTAAVNPPQMPPADARVGGGLDTSKDQSSVPPPVGPTNAPQGMPESVAQAKGTIKGAEDTAAANAKYYDSLHRGLSGSAMIAAQQKQNIDLLRQVAASPNFTPGAGSDAALWLQRVAAQLHINTAGAAPREIFNQVSARVLADQMSGIKSMASETGEAGGRIFKPMLDLEEKANITPDDTLAGINAKLNLLDNAGNLMMKWGDRADDYIKSHGTLDAGFEKALRADIAQSRVPNIVPTGAKTQSFATPADAHAALASGKLKKGEPFQTPDGRILVAQ